MLITKNQLRAIIKEELVRTVIIREVRQYQKTHGRIDEGFLADLAKKYGVQKKLVSAILAGSIAMGAVAPKTAEAGKLMKRGHDTEQQAEKSIYDEITPELKEVTKADAMKIEHTPAGKVLYLIYKSADGTLPDKIDHSASGWNMVYPDGEEGVMKEWATETAEKLGYWQLSSITHPDRSFSSK